MSDMDKIAVQVQTRMRELAPVDTGNLRDSISIVKIGDRVQIGPVGVDYAAAQEYGSKPHVIIARPGKVLVFTMNDKKYFRKSVRHPGNKPHPYIRPAGDWAREQFANQVAVTGASMLKGKKNAVLPS